MIMIGDIGGFGGVVLVLPVLFMNWYSERMFKASIYHEVPIRESKQTKNKLNK